MDYFNRRCVIEATDFNLFNLFSEEYDGDYILDFGHRKVRLNNIIPMKYYRHTTKNKIEVDIYYKGKKLGIKEKDNERYNILFLALYSNDIRFCFIWL